MTTSNLISLPADVPWTLLATSDDMMDSTYGDSKYPPKWFSSLAVFYYEAPREEQPYQNRTITFLKISCSIAGLVIVKPQSPPLGADPKYLKYLKSHPWVIQYINKSKILSKPAPCNGAMVQISVFPNKAHKIPSLDRHPIIVDFEPKKRELYESAVDNKQYMSYSRSGLSVKKSQKTIESQETGWNVGFSAKYSGEEASGGMQTGMSSKFGTSYETVDMISQDFSREKRENYSFTTNITQMYNLLNSYYIGTNRAMFTIQPRPHITDTEFIFFGGPQRLEGIQEFFLIVERGDEIPGLCVEATLETANVMVRNSYNAKIIKKSDLTQGDNGKKLATALGLSDSDLDTKIEALVSRWNAMSPGDRSNIALLVAHGFAYDSWKKSMEEVGKKASISKADWETGEKVIKQTGVIPTDATEDLVVIYEVGISSGQVALLGRTTGACFLKEQHVEQRVGESYLAFEKAVAPSSLMFGAMMKGIERAAAANLFSETVAREMLGSVGSPNRFPMGQASIKESTFVQEAMIDALMEMPDDHAYNVRLDRIEGVSASVGDRLKAMFGVSRRKDALRIELSDLRARLNLTEIEARRLRTALIGDGPNLEEQIVATVEVPNVGGMTLPEASRMITEVGLKVNPEVVQRDGSEIRDTVLSQHPDAGVMLARGQSVSMVVSAGPVMVPNVSGQQVDEAVARLEQVPLRVVRAFVATDEQPDGHAVGTSPPANAQLAASSQVVLLIAGRENREPHEK